MDQSQWKDGVHDCVCVCVLVDLMKSVCSVEVSQLVACRVCQRLQVLLDDGVNGLLKIVQTARCHLLPTNNPVVTPSSVCGK